MTELELIGWRKDRAEWALACCADEADPAKRLGWVQWYWETIKAGPEASPPVGTPIDIEAYAQRAAARRASGQEADVVQVVGIAG
jgi:hypothetical protein